MSARKRGRPPSQTAAAMMRRVLRRLAEPGARLVPEGGETGMPAAFVLSPAGGGKGRAQRLDPALVREMRAAGLIAALPTAPSALALTAEGKAALRRAEALGQPFEAQHRVMGGRFVPAGGGEAGTLHAVNLAESPLAWLASRKRAGGVPFLAPDLVAAGERLREDYERAQLMPRITVNWERPMAGGARAPESLTLSEAAMAARRRVSAALGAVGPELETVLVAVCCHLQGLKAAEQQLGLPSRAGKIVLKIALGALARHYGIVSRRTKAEITAWRAEAQT